MNNMVTVFIATLCLAIAVYAKVDEREWYAARSFAQDMMFPLAAAAYTDNFAMMKKCLKRVDNKAVTVGDHMLDVKCLKGDNMLCKAFIAALPSHGAIVISFRGTDNGRWQLLDEAMGCSEKHKWSEKYGGGLVCGYFADVFERLLNQLDVQLTSFIQYPQYRQYELWITGHSLGGALANLAAAWASTVFPKNKVRLVTFGAPRVGTLEFKNALETKVPTIYRVTHSKDPVVHIPPFEDYYWHAGKELWYKNGMSHSTDFCHGKNNGDCIETCEAPEVKDRAYYGCAGSIGRTDFIKNLKKLISYHTTYYKHVSGWGIKGCPDKE